MENKGIENYGWSAAWEKRWSEEQLEFASRRPARIIADHGHMQRLITADGECWGKVSGKLRHDSLEAGLAPAVGDWVAVAGEQGEEAVIHHVLPRQSRVSGKPLAR